MSLGAPKNPSAASDEDTEISLYAAGQTIYPRAVSGLFSQWRWGLVWLTQILYFGLPWLQWNDRQAVLFDLESRRFFLFNLILYPHDLIYLTGLLVISALALFLFTAVAGRLWCGYACPQTVYTEIYLWIEKKVEGDRAARMRLDQSSMSLEKVGKKWLKHFLWMAFGLWTGFTFVGYFTPIHELGSAMIGWELGPWQTFWVVFYGFATYGNAGFMREQVCKYMCPYARFQSAMFDKDTMIVTYDDKRGEPRGARPRKADPQALGLGACVDCSLCVQVCPTGIDIRKGLQYECIGCAACIDVCDDVMDKVGYARGLVRYSTQNAVANGWATKQILRRVARPRVLIYTGILLAVTVAMVTSLYLRTPLKVDVIRDRGALARMVEMGRIENVYRLQILNATEQLKTYRLVVRGLSGMVIVSDAVVTVQPTEVRSVAVTVQVPPNTAAPGSHPIFFEIAAETDPRMHVDVKSTFIIPR